MTDEKSVRERGAAIRRKVLGAAYTDAAAKNRNAFNADFQDFTIDTVWGGIWTRGVFEPRQRSMLTIAILAAMGKDDELKMHVKASVNTGLSREEVKEILLHVAVYAGFPAGNTGTRIAGQAYAEIDAAAKTP